VKKIVLLAGLLAMSWTIGVGCVVDGGGGGVVVPGDCNNVSCMEAMTAGLAMQNVVLCDAASDTAYGNLIDCACTGGSCVDVCGDNLCSDNGASTDCLDCLSQTECAGDQTVCANN
jgi:hypothetical protein